MSHISMRVIFSEKVQELEEKVEPYLQYEGLEVMVSDDAPNEIKELYVELKKCIHEEYEEALQDNM